MLSPEESLSIAQMVLQRPVLGISSNEIARGALLVIMLTMGLSLRISDFRHLFRQPVAVAAGLTGQLLVLPCFAFLLAWLFSPPAPVVIGLIILACCPGAATSNFFSYLARGDIALSVVLTTINGFVVVFTLPVFVNFGLDLFIGETQPIRLPVLKTMFEVFKLLVLPVVTGMLMRRYLKKAFADRLQKVGSMLSFAALVLIIVIALAGLWEKLPVLIAEAGPMALALNGGMMTIGFLAGFLFKLREAQRRAIAVEMGIQNFLLSIVIALTILKMPEVAVFAIGYMFVMNITAFLFVGWCRLIRDRTQPA